MKILVTGFDPFGGETVNPAFEAVKLLPDEIGGAEIVKCEIPTVFGTAAEKVAAAIDELQPAAVICVGQAGGRSAVTVERVAVNLRDASLGDNAGNTFCDAPIAEDGDAAYFATLPTRRIVSRIREAGIPAALSYTAGVYVCNDVMYCTLRYLKANHPGVLGGFIHVPFSPAQAAAKGGSVPSMALGDTARALEAAILATIEELKR